MRKIITLVTILCMMFTTTTMAFAQENPNAVYVERQSFQFDEDDIYLQSKQLKIKTDNESNILFSQSIQESGCFSNFLSSLLMKGESIIGIGTATVYFDEKELDSERIAPMTIREVADAHATGNKKTNGNLTLYTVATRAAGGLHAYTCAEWRAGTNGDGKTSWGLEEDKISITAQKKGLWIVNENFSANTVGGSSLENYHLEDVGYTSVVYSFEEYCAEDSKKNVNFAVVSATYNGNLDGDPYNCKSTYVHTWADTSVSYTIGATDCSITMSSSKAAWQLASYVTVS